MKMLEFLVDNIFVVFATKVFQQTVGIPMCTNCAPLPADIFLYSYEADCKQTHGNLILQKSLHFRARLNFNVEQNYLCHVVDHT